MTKDKGIKKEKAKKAPPLPKEYWTGYKLHEQTETCFYCMGERATFDIKGKRYPALGADGATVVVTNAMHL